MAKAFNLDKGSLAVMHSLNEHVFLIPRDEVARTVFFYGDGPFIVIKFEDGSEHFLVFENQSNVRTNVNRVFVIFVVSATIIIVFTAVSSLDRWNRKRRRRRRRSSRR